LDIKNLKYDFYI